MNNLISLSHERARVMKLECANKWKMETQRNYPFFKKPILILKSKCCQNLHQVSLVSSVCLEL